MRTIATDLERGIKTAGQSVYYSLGSPDWENLTGGPYAQDTYTYFAPDDPASRWPLGEYACMSMANWGNEDSWYSAQMRLNQALGFGTYEQSIKVGAGSGVTSTFYLNEFTGQQNQEIDFEFAGDQSEGCDSSKCWTNVWSHGTAHSKCADLWGNGAPPVPPPDSTQGWGFDVYRYKIDWEPRMVRWSVDLTGSGNQYTLLRRQKMASIGPVYNEGDLYVFMSFWQGWTPDNSPFTGSPPANGCQCAGSGPCYQAYYFQSLKFTPSSHNTMIKLE